MRKILLSLFMVLFISTFIFSMTIQKATIKAVHGKVEANIFGVKWEPAFKSLKLYTHSKIRTGKNAYCELEVDEGRIVKIKPKTEMSLANLTAFKNKEGKKQVKIKLNLKKGSIFSKVRKLSNQEKFVISTPTAVCGVRGTKFLTEYEDATNVSVLEGAVESYNPAFPDKVSLIESGNFCSISKGKKPSAIRKMSAKQMKQLETLEVKKIIDTTKKVYIKPEFIDFNVSKVAKKTYNYKITITKINPEKQNIYLFLYLQNTSGSSELISKNILSLKSSANNIYSYETTVIHTKPGKYFYRFSVENK